MTERARDIDDPVAEIRQWRAKMYKRVGGTLESLARLLEKKDKGRQRQPNDSVRRRRKSA